jgi:hypothetical protein
VICSLAALQILLSPDDITHILPVQEVRLVLFLLDLEQYRLNYECSKLKGLTQSSTLPRAPHGSLHTGGVSPPLGLQINAESRL